MHCVHVKTRRWESDRPGVEPTSPRSIVWGQYHSPEKASCDKWYWNPSPDISGYMCGARRVERGLLITTVQVPEQVWTTRFVVMMFGNSQSTRHLQGALQLLSKRHMQNRFPQVPERISFSSSDGDPQQFNLDLPMKPGTIRNKWLKSRNWNRRSLRVAAPKSLVHAE